MNQNERNDEPHLLFLPTTEAEFNSLVDQVVEQYELKDRRHASAVIAVTIRHLPNDQATTTLRYLGHCVIKNLANFTANIQSQKLKHESDVETLANKLATNPLDQQAYDELTKMAQDGSPKAADALALFNQREGKTEQDDNVVPIQGA